ncbi:hypothetical protein ABVT39_027771 [Epinephelus coioides]
MDPTDYERIIKYKMKNEYPANFSKSEKFLLQRKASLYAIEGGELYYWRYKGTAKTIKTKVVCGADEANKIFVEFHDSPTGAHTDQTKTRESISKRFYWPGMSVDINKWFEHLTFYEVFDKCLFSPGTDVRLIELIHRFLLSGLSLPDGIR